MTAVDGTAAGDAFCAALLVSLLEGRDRGGGAAPRVRRGSDRRLAAGRATVTSHRRRAGRDTAHVSTPILLDCDPGHDDAIALFLALASPELELLGVTTVAGNQTLEKTTANAIRLLDAVGRAEIPVAAGADRPFVREQLRRRVRPRRVGPRRPGPAAARAGRPTAATRSSSSPTRSTRPQRPVTLVPIGPLTNIALLLALHPGIGERIERIVLMGGAIAEGNVTPAAEFNIWADPEAARRVFASGIDLTMVGLDVTHQALVGEAEAERMRAAGRAGGIVADLLGFYGRFHREQYGWAGSPIHDAVAVAHVAQPGLLETKHRRVDVDCSWELSRGRTLVDLWERMGQPANCHVATGIDAPGFVELLVERISSLP